MRLSVTADIFRRAAFAQVVTYLAGAAPMPMGEKLQNRPPGRNEGAPEGGYTGGPDLPGISSCGAERSRSSPQLWALRFSPRCAEGLEAITHTHLD
jgi:hypothetical protein